MDRLNERLGIAHTALGRLREVAAGHESDALVRDAAIQRFEFTFEAAWKAAQRYLADIEGLAVGSPKAAARAAGAVGLLEATEVEELLAMADDRNLTVHTYDEALARAIYRRLASHAHLLGRWLDAMNERSAPRG